MNSTLPLYESFNAKYLTYQQVAESFISNDEFIQLIGNNHTLLMGPRGCGKTTLLKMLSPRALDYWNTEDSKSIKSKINFTAIYIPSDIQWKMSLSYLNKHLENEQDFNEKIANFLITTNIQLALCKTVFSLLEINVFRDRDKMLIEDRICKSLIDAWMIEDASTASFDDIEISLQKRVLKINSFLNQLIFKKRGENLTDELPTYIFNDFFDLVKLGCAIFEKELDLNNDHKWALCFDEIEIAPKFFQIRLLKFFRSVDQKYLFKLTTTPLFNLENHLVEASQDNDFKTIKLWVHDETGSNRWREFCNSLVTERLRRRFNNQTLIPSQVFGEYSLDDIIQKEIKHTEKFESGTGKGSSVHLLFSSLAKRDDSFSKFLLNRGVDPLNPYSQNKEQDKSIFLKYKVNSLYRFLFKYRTRKSPAIHYGIPYIYDICDGNPRLVISLVNEMLTLHEHDFTGNDYSIPINKQSDIILEMSKKYFNLIKNHPDATLTVRNKEFNLANDVIKKIGNFIYSNLIKEDFPKTVPTTFTVDYEIDQKIIRLLEQALYVGAIVYLDPIESLSNTGIIGKRFRLSYILTPLFRIPNRVYSQINLKSILASDETEGQSKLEFDS